MSPPVIGTMNTLDVVGCSIPRNEPHGYLERWTNEVGGRTGAPNCARPAGRLTSRTRRSLRRYGTRSATASVLTRGAQDVNDAAVALYSRGFAPSRA